MRIYPAIDLRRGRVVQLAGGDLSNVILERGDAGTQAKMWKEAGASWVHVVDLDAAFGGAHQWNQLPRVLHAGLRIQFGGGVRSMTQIQQLIELGVERVVVGTQGVKNPLWARELGKIFPGRIILAIDARGRDVVVEGWTEATGQDVVALARSLDDAGLAGFLYTQVGPDGDGEDEQPLDRAVVEDLRRNAPRTPLIVAGGKTTAGDLEFLAAAGVAGVVLGLAIYTGDLDLSAAVRKFDRPDPRPPVRPEVHERRPDNRVWSDGDSEE